MKRQIIIEDFEFRNKYLMVWFTLDYEENTRFSKIREKQFKEFLKDSGMDIFLEEYKTWRDEYCDKALIKEFLEHHFSFWAFPEPT